MTKHYLFLNKDISVNIDNHRIFITKVDSRKKEFKIYDKRYLVLWYVKRRQNICVVIYQKI